MDQIKRLLDALRGTLQGEPLRAIGYGAGVIIYVVAGISGAIPDQSLDQSITAALTLAGTIAAIVETARRYVYSPATVEAIVTELIQDQAPAPDAGPVEGDGNG